MSNHWFISAIQLLAMVGAALVAFILLAGIDDGIKFLRKNHRRVKDTRRG